jgi:aspartyl-tRNA(Asn)/glutamyl-tRNA(Gln) amidotransferase subunit A
MSQSCLQIAAAVQAHQTTARAVCDAALAAAEKLQEKWRAFTLITPELARRQAEEVDRRVGRGEKLPLAGVPLAVKDLVDVAGLPTTCASKAFAKNVARVDSTVVKRLVAAGAVLIGKLNLHECAFGFTGENQTYGNCKNPWNAEQIAGGSSSGSAVAVALDICPLALGSDTGGSIRHPAALCGITGLKPTYGRVPLTGVAPLSWSFDHVGPMAHTAAEAALALGVLAGADSEDEACAQRPVPNYLAEIERGVRGLRIGLPGKWFFGALEPDVDSAVRAAIDKLLGLGMQKFDVELPHLEEIVGAHRAILFPEASSYHQARLAEAPQHYGDDVRPLLLAGLFLPAIHYVKAQRLRRLVRNRWAEVFEKVDLLLTPTTPIVATRFGQQTALLPGGERPLVRAYLDSTLPFNFSGHPAMSIPCGFSREGLPIGIQLVGKPFDEATILRVAHHYQQATDWHKRRPPAND